MYRIIDKRGNRKTQRLMLLAKESGAALACKAPNILRERAYSLGIVGIDFISYDELLTNPNKYNKVLIDELEVFVNYYVLNNTMIGYSLSAED
jgi:hypothetical protein